MKRATTLLRALRQIRYKQCLYTGSAARDALNAVHWASHETIGEQLGKNASPFVGTVGRFARHYGGGITGSSVSHIHGLDNVPKGVTLSACYESLKASGHVQPDYSQGKVIERLNILQQELSNYTSGWGQHTDDTPKGLYVQGGVGCGKTFCMDLFFQCLDVENKLRVHFHSFMLSVHRRLFELQKLAGQDPLCIVAREIAESASVICFDEFQVTDVADAMILKRLLELLLEHSVVFVMTSNRLPDELYLNGLNRPQFIPAIHLIKEHCDVFPFPIESPDYRLMGEDSKTWIYPLDEAAHDKFHEMCKKVTKNKKHKTGVLEVQGRRVKVPRVVGGVAKFSFKDLCEDVKGAADYIAIANAYHTVLLEGIPKMSENQLPFARRFITLVDVLYEHHVKLIALADGPVEETYIPLEKSSTRDEDFAWDRTVSRLTEMQSAEYLKDQWRGGSGFLRKLEIEVLTDEELKEIWDVYDTNNDGHLSLEELSALIADVNELKGGRRFVDGTELKVLFKDLHADADGSRDIEWEEFREYFRSNGGFMHVMESHYHFTSTCAN